MGQIVSRVAVALFGKGGTHSAARREDMVYVALKVCAGAVCLVMLPSLSCVIVLQSGVLSWA